MLLDRANWIDDPTQTCLPLNEKARQMTTPNVLIYDNSDLNVPYRQVAVFDHGQPRHFQEPIPDWLRPVLP